MKEWKTESDRHHFENEQKIILWKHISNRNAKKVKLLDIEMHPLQLPITRNRIMAIWNVHLII